MMKQGFFLSAFFLLFVRTFVFCWFWIVDGPVCAMTFGSRKITITTSFFGSAYFSHKGFLYFSNMSWLSIVPGIVTITSHGISRPPWINDYLLLFVDDNCASTFAPQSMRNFVIRESSIGKCPTVWPLLFIVLIAKSSNGLFVSWAHTSFSLFVGTQALL